ncbi:MAG: sigma-70 family RNA polymerase sigma factor [bacterium]|nr:sigma-70 family RNA polymerase sigma factor [bacterium]
MDNQLQPLIEIASIEQLAVASKNGNQAAFSELYQRYNKSIYKKVVFHVKNIDDAQDVLQKTFFQAWRNIDKLRDPKCFGKWLLRIALNIALDVHRRKHPTRSLNNLSLKETPTYRVTPDSILLAEENEQLWACLKNLKLKNRNILIARYFRELTLQEIADESDALVSTIKSQLHRARRLLAIKLKENEGE